MRLLLDRGADVNAKNNVSTCECTDVSVSLSVCLSVCLSVSCVVDMYAVIVNYNMYIRGAIMAIALIPVMMGWGDRMEGLLFIGPLRMDMPTL